MDNRDEVKAFLSSRRAKISPARAGLTSYNRNRRVPGRRRSEVADLAGVLGLTTEVPAFAGNRRGDVLAANPIADALRLLASWSVILKF